MEGGFESVVGPGHEEVADVADYVSLWGVERWVVSIRVVEGGEEGGGEGEGERDGKMGRWEDGKMGRWEDGKMGRWEDGKMGRWEDGKMG